jgi:hypothetical protein
MASLRLSQKWEESIYEVQTSDEVVAGPDGIWNLPQRQLGNRTEWLKAQADAMITALDEINGEVIQPDIAARLDRLAKTRSEIIAVMREMGVDVPENIPFAELANLIPQIAPGGDVSNVVNSPWFNPGTMLGGITWSDPTIDFEYIEIVSVLGGGEVIARIEPGVQFWQPPAGTHQFRIRAKLPSGNSTRGVLLPETTYESVYRANLMSVTIPMAAANQVVLVFDNFVKITNASGFSISGTNDTLEFLDQPDARTVRLRLSSRFFTQHGAYSLSYDPAVGNVLQNDGTPIDPITGHTIENYADYTPAIFTSAQIPQKEPATLVLVMSRPIKITDPTAFTLSGTTAKIVSIVSDGVTIEFALTEPVDHSGVESDVRLSFSGVGATDDAGQQVEAFTDRAVTNNSTNRAISIQTAEVPANNSLHLIVVMQGAVKMTTAKGWSLVSPNQERLPDLSEMEFTISDGTITFQLDVDLLLGRSFTVSYDGGGSLRAVSNNDKIMAFSHTVINNSTNTGGIPAGGSERNLAIVVHGRENQSAADVREICERVHRTVESGQVQNFNHDFFFLAPTAENPFNVPAMNGHGAVNVTHNADFGAHGKHLGFRIVSNNPHRGKNGFNQDHVVFSSMNILSMFRMNPTATNVGGYAASQMRQYVLNNVLPEKKKQGIPFAESWMAEPPRHVSRHGGETNHEFDVITDRLYLPTEFEVFGLHAMSNANAETAANQGRYGFYNRDALLNGAPFRIKRSSISTATSWYLASAGSRRLTCFCIALFNGHASDSSSIALQGVAPAFCIA